MSYLEVLVTFIAVSIILLTADIYPQTAEELYQKGIQYEEIKGDLNKAIESYESVLLKAASARKTAALAQLHIGLCYEKLGKNNLDKAVAGFQQVIEKFPDQQEAVRIAKEKLTAYDNSEEDIAEAKKTIDDYYQAFKDKDGVKVISYHSKNYYDNSLWGKLGDKTADEEFIEYLNEAYFTPWETISWNYKIKRVVKEGFNYVVYHDVEIIVSDEHNKNITLSRAIDFPYVVTKENGKWKINLKKDNISYDSKLPDTYKTLGKNKTEPGTPGLIYVSHIGECFVTVIEPSQRQITDQLLSHYGSTSVEFAAEGKRGFITNYFSNEITVFNRKNYREITNIAVGEHPTNMFVSPDGKIIAVVHQSNAGMWILDAETYEVIKKYPEITGIIKMEPLKKKIYCSAIFSPYVHVLNIDDLSIQKSILTGGRPMDLEFSPDGRYLYIPNYDLNEVEKIDTETDSVVARIRNVTDARGIAVSRDNKYAFVTNVVSNTITVIDLAADTVLKVIPVGNMPTSAAVTLDNKSLYITNQAAGTLSVIDIDKLTLVQTIEVAKNPITVQVL
jgi:YVTN family beta-propeller protein